MESPVNLKQLEVFLAVAESGSFSRGAEATFITQSTVSQHISSLEQEFGLRLFDRTGKGALLTEGGKLLAEYAGRLLHDARAIESAMSRFRGIEDALLKVGASNIPGSYMVPAALPLLFASFPGMRLAIVQTDSGDILERLSREEVEIGVVGSTFAREGFRFTPLGHDEILLVVPSRHRWQGRAAIQCEELADEPVVMRESGSGTGNTVSSALLRAGFDPLRMRVRAILGGNEAVKHAVAGGVGVAFVSALSVRGELARGELVAVEVAGVRIVRSFFLAVRDGRELSPAATAFAGIMQELYGESVDG
jgi:LysR family transcriptional regulator, low CO2-responsive transcriptional regulator